jgi:hypothetical protein
MCAYASLFLRALRSATWKLSKDPGINRRTSVRQWGIANSIERHFTINKLSTLITPAWDVRCATRIIWVPRICETSGVRTSENITNEPLAKVQLKK